MKRVTKVHTDSFLEALTNLSNKYGLAISGASVIVVMEDIDFEFSYFIDDKSTLSRI